MENTDDLDLAGGIDIQEVVDGAIVRGHVGGEKVLLVRRKEDYFAIGAECTHYHAQLANVLIVDETIRLVGSLRGDGAHKATAGW